MLSAAFAVLPLALACAPSARAQLPTDVDPLHARMLIVGDRQLEEAFGRRLTRRLREGMPTWKVAAISVERVDARAVDELIREDDAVIVVVAGAELVAVSTAARRVSVGDLAQVQAVAELIVSKRGRRCIWVGPPKIVGRAWARFQGAEQVSQKIGQAIRARARGCEFVDSVAFTHGGAAMRYEDGLRLRPEPAQRWAEEIAARLVRLVR